MVVVRPVDRPSHGQHRIMTNARFGPALRAVLTTPELQAHRVRGSDFDELVRQGRIHVQG